jgi:hypothetical protein
MFILTYFMVNIYRIYYRNSCFVVFLFHCKTVNDEITGPPTWNLFNSRAHVAECVKMKLLRTTRQFQFSDHEFYTKNAIYNDILYYSTFNIAAFAAASLQFLLEPCTFRSWLGGLKSIAMTSLEGAIRLYRSKCERSARKSMTSGANFGEFHDLFDKKKCRPQGEGCYNVTGIVSFTFSIQPSMAT